MLAVGLLACLAPAAEASLPRSVDDPALRAAIAAADPAPPPADPSYRLLARAPAGYGLLPREPVCVSPAPYPETRVRASGFLAEAQRPEIKQLSLDLAVGVCDGPSMYQFAGYDPVNNGDPLGLATLGEIWGASKELASQGWNWTKSLFTSGPDETVEAGRRTAEAGSEFDAMHRDGQTRRPRYFDCMMVEDYDCPPPRTWNGEQLEEVRDVAQPAGVLLVSGGETALRAADTLATYLLAAGLAVELVERQLVKRYGERVAAEVFAARAERQAPRAGPRLLGPATRFGEKIEGQLAERGWTKRLVQSSIDDPVRTVVTRDTRHLPGGARLDDPATAYYNRRGGYVVRNDRTGDLVQISDRTDSTWRAPWD